MTIWCKIQVIIDPLYSISVNDNYTKHKKMETELEDKLISSVVAIFPFLYFAINRAKS